MAHSITNKMPEIFKWQKRTRNDDKKRSLILDLFQRLSKNGFMEAECVEKIDDMLQHSAVKDLQLMDIVEFGRILHAEMSASMDAGAPWKSCRSGDTILYDVSLPHLCEAYRWRRN